MSFVRMLSLLLFGFSFCFPQSNEETRALRKEMESIKEAQKAIQKDIEEIKNLLRNRPQPVQPAQPAQPPQDVVLTVGDAPFMGNKDARVTLVEFGDYQCPFCARHFSRTLPQLVADYIKSGKVKYVLRDFPLEPLHPAAMKVAEAAHCASDEGKYWQMHDRLLARQAALDANKLLTEAEAVGLNVSVFQQCLDSGKYAAKVRKDLEEGRKAGVGGTPTFYLGLTAPGAGTIHAAKTLVGAQPYAAFKEAIDSLLASK